MEPRTLRLTLEYDGTGFRGWARQPDKRTIEGVMRDALGTVFPVWDNLVVAGRTDAGVHALGQVASARVEGGPPGEHVAEALNAELPEDVAILSAAETADGLPREVLGPRPRLPLPRVRRRTRSPFDARRALWWPRPLDDDALAEAGRLLHGNHDFTAFTPTETRHGTFTRTVAAAAWERHGEELHFTVTADSFLRHMVRTLVGTMLERRRTSSHGSSRADRGRRRLDGAALGPLLGGVEY